MAEAEEQLDGASPDEDRVGEGLEHLQRAGLELVGAARAFLDVAERALADPRALRQLADGAAAAVALARLAGAGDAGAAGDARRGASSGAPAGAGEAGAQRAGRDDGSGVQPIEVD